MSLPANTFSLALLTCLLALPSTLVAQDEPSQILEPTPVPPIATDSSVHILYTGKLLGYFRVPDGQPPDDSASCPNDRDKPSSLAAQEFDTVMKEQALSRTVLVGMGDNFAPEVEARKFCRPPADEPPATGAVRGTPHFQRLGKEYFVWDSKNHGWRGNEHLPKDFLKDLADGRAFVQQDNVAKYFVDEGYAAIVPGKHDFYYGPERLRELAWLLASSDIDNKHTIHEKGVQMLAANLVIETGWKTGHESLSDRKEPPWFIPRFPTAADLTSAANLEVKLSGISDGGSVYPWFQGPSYSLSKPDPDLEHKLQGLKYFLCRAGQEGDPNSIPEPSDSTCTSLKPREKDSEGNYQLLFPWLTGENWITLRPGENYALCADAPVADPRLTDKKGGQRFCVRFSVYVPLLQYPTPGVKPCEDATRAACRVPEPFVLLKKQPGLGKDVAIFGAIDPHLPDYVGLLNLSWMNTNSRYKTEAAVKDPAEALKQLDAYFEKRYQDQNGGKCFDGVKILLAQMSPQEADILATRVGKYQVVVSAADAEKSGVDHTTTTEWQLVPRKASGNVPAPGRVARFLAVPEPFYDQNRKKTDGSAWVVDVGSLEINLSGPNGDNWRLESKHFSKKVDYGSGDPANFWNAVQRRVAHNCLPANLLATTPKEEQIKWLTLCAIQEKTESDIVLLQKRDVFATLPGDTTDLAGDVDAYKKPQPELQDLVDRIIWKGDFLVMSHVPGSVIQKVMAQSKVYEADDKSLLSLSDERDRGLLYVGIRYDQEQGEYVVNGVPLDPNKLYSVAASDFMGGGDTGYTDLGGAQAHPPVVPGDLDSKLLKISSVVCQTLAGRDHELDDCLTSIPRDDYFDDIALAPRNTKNVNTPSEQFESWTFLRPRHQVPGDPSQLNPRLAPTAGAAADATVQQRRLWDFAVTKWTLGINALGHNDSDFDVQNNFVGVSAPGVTAARTSTWASDLLAQYTRSWQNWQILLIPAYTFNTQYKGQADDVRQINQQADLGMFDIVGARLWTGRGPEHFDSVFTVHFETPLARIFNAYALGTTHPGEHGEPIKDQLRFAQDRSYTMLVRPGIRWTRRKSSVEFGPEAGHEWDALDGFTFTTGDLATTCLSTANATISQCVKNAVKANPQSIAPTSEVTSLRSGHNHAGMYWKLSMTVPFHPRVSYVFTDTGDWFFVHYSSDNSTDTRFRDTEQHQLKFTIFPSLSIGPEVDLLLYRNSSTGLLPSHFLRQDTIMMKAQFNFDLFNHRKLERQIEYAPPPAPK